MIYFMSRRNQGLVSPCSVYIESGAFLLGGIILGVWSPFENPSLYQFTSSAMSNFNHTGLTLLVCLALNRCGRHLPSKLGIWLGVFVGSVIVIVLNELDS